MFRDYDVTKREKTFRIFLKVETASGYDTILSMWAYCGKSRLPFFNFIKNYTKTSTDETLTET